jgi:hypothetical protein
LGWEKPNLADIVKEQSDNATSTEKSKKSWKNSKKKDK